MSVDVKIDVDIKDAIRRLDGLAEAAKQHLPRSMLVAAGKVLRDEAKERAPVFDGATALLGGSNVTKPPVPGLLREAIYLAYSEGRSIPSAGKHTYSISWNSSKAPHGHLLEFGHWRINVIQGGYPKKARLESPSWVAAKPFLRPAYDSSISIALQSAMARGKERAQELLSNPSLLEQYGKGTAQPSE